LEIFSEQSSTAIKFPKIKCSKNQIMRFHVVTIFPKILDSYINESIIKRAREKGLAEIIFYDLREWTKDKHRKVDDIPYGGGAGMVLKAEPIINSVKDIKKQCSGNVRTILMSAKGKRWKQQKSVDFIKYDDLILICGRYEGVDDRVCKFIDEEICIGPFVLTGGELPAMSVIDSIIRLVPGVLGNEESVETESFSEAGALEHPHYTRPETIEIGGEKYRVPKILLSGNHKDIDEWRNRKSKKK
jgi:tRNA (guanine37-N1)-methyltransferase